MNLFFRIARRLRHLFRRRQAEADMAEEMRFHLEQRAADYAEDGLPAPEAQFAAQRKFGNVGSIQEQARDTRGWGWLERIIQDLRVAVRQLAKSPAFTLLAVITLGLGIGANTSMFNVLKTIMLKPLPYVDDRRLDRIDRVTAQNPEGRLSPADFRDLQRNSSGYGEVAAYEVRDTSLAEPGRPAEMARAIRTTANFFSLLGIRPQLGRDFQEPEVVPGNDRVVIISQRCWRNRFGRRTDVLGRTIRVDGEPHEIVGVLPESFNDWRHLGVIDLFRPLALDSETAVDRQRPILRVLGRRSALLPHAETGRFIAAFGQRLANDFPEIHAGSTWRAVPLTDTVLDQSGRKMLPMIIGLSGFVLLIACSNLANLLLARTIARAREFAVRAALGASRTQLLRPLIAESLLLALAGGVVAITIALWVADYFALRSTGDNGEQVVFVVDWLVLGWAFGVSLVTALFFGLAPALFALRLDLNTTLKSGGRGATAGRGHQHLRHALVVGQFALAMILLSGAALFIRGLHELNHRRSGWESRQLITGSFVLPTARYADDERMTAFHRLALERVEAIPGVASASISSFSPFFNWTTIQRVHVEGREPPTPGHEPAAVVNRVTARYFETVGTRLLAGRAFDVRDTAASPRVVIIGQAMATALFGKESPLGKRLTPAGGTKGVSGEIVGVVADVKSVLPDPGRVNFQLYQPMPQQPGPRNELAVRTNGVAPSALIDSIRNVMTGLDPDLPVRDLQPADTTVYRENYQLGVLRDILAAFGVLGLGLASLGIYGVITRTMAHRTHEFAIRLALGACLRDITRLVLKSGVKLALVGSAIGLLGAIAVTRLIAAGFPGMDLHCPGVMFGTTVLLVSVALLASWRPARRAGKVDAMTALRAE